MDFWITMIGLVRHRRVIIPAVLAALVLGAAAALLTSASYVSNTTMVLTTTPYGSTQSRNPSQPVGLTNPLLDFNDGLKTTSAILTTVMNTKSVEEQLGVKGSTKLVIDDGRSNPQLLGLNGPFIYVLAQSSSAAGADQVVRNAQSLMRLKLRDWQSDLKAPESTYVSLVDVVPPSAPEVDRGNQIQNGLLGVILGFAGTVGLAYLRLRRSAGSRVERAAPVPAIDARPTAEALPAVKQPGVRDVDAARWGVADVPEQTQSGGNGATTVRPESARDGDHAVTSPAVPMSPSATPAVEVSAPFAVVDPDVELSPDVVSANSGAGSQKDGGLPVWPFTMQQITGLLPGRSEPSPEQAAEATVSTAAHDSERQAARRSGVNGSTTQVGDGVRPETGPETKSIVLG